MKFGKAWHNKSPARSDGPQVSNTSLIRSAAIYVSNLVPGRFLQGSSAVSVKERELFQLETHLHWKRRSRNCLRCCELEGWKGEGIGRMEGWKGGRLG